MAASEANQVLTTYCGACHGADAIQNGRVEAGIDNIDRIEQQVDGPLARHCSSRESRLVAVLNDVGLNGLHDAAGEIAEPPPEDIALVADFIDRDCERLGAICAEDPSIAGCRLVEVENRLERECGECHGRAIRSRAVQLEGFLAIDDMPRMFDEAKVVPCRSADSQIITYMRQGTMPPAGWGPMVAEEGIASIATFIDDLEGLCPSSSAGDPVGAERLEVEAMLRRSCGECHGGRPGDAAGVEGGLAQVDDVGALVGAGVLYPCLERSTLVERMLDGSMPPAGASAPAPSFEEVDQLIALVMRPCQRPGSSVDGSPARSLAERLRLEALPSWYDEAIPRPDVPPIQNECFEFLGDWISCEDYGSSDSSVTVEVPGTVDNCMRACIERPDCTAVVDYSWLNIPDLACHLYLAACDAPAPLSFGEEDGGRHYRKLCAP